MGVSISLLQFCCTGLFGPLHIGMPRAQIEAALGAPDDYMVLSRRERRKYPEAEHWKHSNIWRYGSVELTFDASDLLCAVHIDHLDNVVPAGGEKIQLDPWILRPGLSVAGAQTALDEQQIAYRQRPDPFDESLVHLALEAGPVLYFQMSNGVDTAEPGGLCLLDFPDRLKDAFYDEAGQVLKSARRKRATGGGPEPWSVFSRVT